MKRVLILGAAGKLGSEISQQLEILPDIQQTCYDVRKIPYQRKKSNNIQADACDTEALRKAMTDQDYIVYALNGDWLAQAKALVSVLNDRRDVRILWVTGMGIHNEVSGIHGLMWKRYTTMYPDYIKAADHIANSGIPYTLIRTADLTDTDDISYHLHRAGERANSRYVSRAAVAALITEMIHSGDNFGLNESLGITG